MADPRRGGTFAQETDEEKKKQESSPSPSLLLREGTQVSFPLLRSVGITAVSAADARLLKATEADVEEEEEALGRPKSTTTK